MNLKSHLTNMGQLQTMTLAMIGANIILAVGIVWSVVSLSGNHERVVLVPPNLDKKAQIAWDHADKEYLKSFGLYMASLVGNIQPKSSTVVLDAASAFMDPTIYNEFRRQLLLIIEDPTFKASGSVISFLPQSIQYESETSRVFVTGSIITSTAGSTKYQKNVVYEIGARIRNGRPWVTHFTSYEGNAIHSVNWWAQKSQRDGTAIPAYAIPGKSGAKDATEDAARASDLSPMHFQAEGDQAPADQPQPQPQPTQD